MKCDVEEQSRGSEIEWKEGRNQKKETATLMNGLQMAFDYCDNNIKQQQTIVPLLMDL